MPVETFKIAHLSDLHLAKAPNVKGLFDTGVRKGIVKFFQAIRDRDGGRCIGSYREADLRALVRSLNALNQKDPDRFDVYLVTGDLATTGNAENLAAAKSFISGKIPIGVPTGNSAFSEDGFHFPQSKLAILPGNHDRYVHPWLKPIGGLFEDAAHFGHNWLSGSPQCTSGHPRVKTFTFTKSQAKLHIVAADFSYLEHNCPRFFWKYLGKGRVDRDILDALIQVTQEKQKEGLVLWALHFPPDLANSKDIFLRVTGRRLLACHALELKIPLIFAGHTHIANDQGFIRGWRRDHTTRVICAGSPCAFDSKEKMFYEVSVGVGSDHSLKSLSVLRHAKRNITGPHSFSQVSFQPIP